MSITTKSQWYVRHAKDPFVKQSIVDNYRSRASYKLISLQEKHRILRPGCSVLDLGSFPGGWSQVASKYATSSGLVVAVDLEWMDPLKNVRFIQGDFTLADVREQVERELKESGRDGFDVVLSDMAHKFSGNRTVDTARVLELAEVAYKTSVSHLSKDGSFVTKILYGEGFQEFLKMTKDRFKRVVVEKPDASRKTSAEVYLVCKGFKR